MKMQEMPVEIAVNNHRCREANHLTSGVVRDASDKLGESYAVVVEGRLMPVRFTKRAEAWRHHDEMVEALQGGL